MEFFFIKSMMALISLRSTSSSGVGAIDNSRAMAVHLSKKAVTDGATLLQANSKIGPTLGSRLQSVKK
jgi:hypothetical protein